MAERFDLIVIGAGPGGYVAAIRAAQLGMKTAIVERDAPGGVCLNRGCIPTKALLHCAEVGRTLADAERFGWKVAEPELDFPRMLKHAQATADKLSAGVSYLLKKNNIHVLKGQGRLLGQGEVEVENTDQTNRYVAAHVVLATGASPRALAEFPFSEPAVWHSTDALNPAEIPQRLLVIGSGAIGVEFASLYNSLGSSVTVVEIRDQILPAEDSEISAYARAAFEKQGVEILTSTECTNVVIEPSTVTLDLACEGGSPQLRSFDKVLVAIGIRGNIDNLGLEHTAVQTENGQIVTDAWKATSEPGVYAVGDVTGAPWLAHKASHEASCCVERIAGLESAHALNLSTIPGCTYSHPQVASIGMSEAQARDADRSIAVGRFPFAANGKALAVGAAEGLVKTVFDADSGEILGVHMVGEGVTEMINSISVAMTLECTEEFLMRTVFAHPTLSEVVHESTLDAFGRAIHH